MAARNSSPMGWFRRGVIPAFLFSCAMAASAQAQESAHQIFDLINDCAKAKAIDDCRQYVTADSVALYDRFNKYGLSSCLPDDVTFVSEEKGKEQTTIRARTDVNGQLKYMRLVFSREEDQWKFDIPASLKRGMGEKWEQKVAMTEALYLAMQQQMGGKLDCNTARSLAK